MKKNNKAFSLVEIIVATGILTISVFGVYKLIAENNKIITNSDNYSQAYSLFIPLKECIENIGFTSFYSALPGTIDYEFNFGSDQKGCQTTGTDIVEFDNIEYELSGNITGSGITYIDWELNIFSQQSGNIKFDYKMVK